MNLNYIAILLILIVSVSIPVVLLILSSILGPKKYSVSKSEPFECGSKPIGSPKQRFSVKFYLIAILFLVFEIEVIALYLWAILFRELSIFGFIEMFIFLAVLFAGFIYVWREGGFEWGDSLVDSG